eukprot:7045149-Pyramimonas_sp.AAC.1
MEGLAAKEARVSQDVRSNVLLRERRARLVRMRILRATLDACDAEAENRVVPRVKKVAPVPSPPSAASLSLFSTDHCLDETGRRCTRCGGSATKARTTLWRQSP